MVQVCHCAAGPFVHRAVFPAVRQAAISAVLHIAPPLIPPPAWNNTHGLCSAAWGWASSADICSMVARRQAIDLPCHIARIRCALMRAHGVRRRSANAHRCPRGVCARCAHVLVGGACFGSAGHNCFGAVLCPITMSDFVIAVVTDAMLDGVVAGFPQTYATKVGGASNAMRSACGA